MRNEQWRSVNASTPPTGVAVHIYCTKSGMETIGSFDGYDWRTYLGSTDCKVTRWKPIEN